MIRNVPNYSIIHDAIEQRDPEKAEEVFRNIDEQLRLPISDREKAELLLGKASLSGIIHRFDDAREQLRVAAEYAPHDPDVQIQVDFINACMYDEQGKPAEAAASLAEVLSKHSERFRNDPDFRFMYEDIQQRRGLDLFTIRRYDEAVPVLKEVLSFQLAPEVRTVIFGETWALL